MMRDLEEHLLRNNHTATNSTPLTYKIDDLSVIRLALAQQRQCDVRI